MLPRTIGLFLLIALCAQTSCRHVSHVVNRMSETEPPSTDLTPHEESADETSIAEPRNAPVATKKEELDLVSGLDENESDTTVTATHTSEAVSQPATSSPETDPETSSPPDDPDLTKKEFILAASEELTLDELVALSLTNNPAIHQAAATAQKARGVRSQIGLCPNPTIGYMSQEMGVEGTAGGQGAFVSQMIVLGDKLSWNQRVADQEVQSLLWQVESQRYRVQNDVRRQYYRTLGAQQRLHVAEELVRIAEAGLKNATTLKQANQAAQPDVLQARVQLREVQILHQNTAYEYDASWDILAALVGLPSLEPVPLKDILEDQQPARDRETAWSQIVAISPQLREAYAKVEQARAQIQREKVQPIPNLQVQVSAMHMNAVDDNVAGVMLGVPVPIFNANEGNIDRAAAEYHRATWNAQRLEMSLKASLATAFSDYQQALNRARTYRDQILPAETETLELIEAAYPLQFDFLRLLTARRSYFEARIEYLKALVDLRTTEVALDGLLLSGGLNDVTDTSFNDDLRMRAFNGR